MEFGRLIRVRKYRADATIYVVAEPEAEKAINILKVALARPDNNYEDLGLVSDAVLDALSLQSGMFART